jgi:hypothetical protein
LGGPNEFGETEGRSKIGHKVEVYLDERDIIKWMLEGRGGLGKYSIACIDDIQTVLLEDHEKQAIERLNTHRRCYV